MKNIIKVAMIQMGVSKSKEENLHKAECLVKRAGENGSHIVILPEMFQTPYNNYYFKKFAEDKDGVTRKRLSMMARDNNIILIGGSIPEKAGDNIYNTCFIYDEKGIEIGYHRKVFLFDINIKGRQKFCESETFSRGDKATIINTKFGKIGIMICFDIRFQELARKLSAKGAEMIVVPAAFNMTTGPMHWELSFRMRAVDNQLYMIGVAPARNTNNSYISYANSIITNPWGEVIARGGTGEEIVYSDIDLDLNKKVRNELPILKTLSNTEIENIR